MKKVFLVLSFLLLPAMLFAMASSLHIREDLFDNPKELAAFVTSDIQGKEAARYESMEIDLLIGSPGSAIWENFGHAAFIVRQEGLPNIAFDYGIFTFDSSFYGNFILGKLYYEVYKTYADYRMESLVEEDRSVHLLKLDLTAQQKKDMYEFLCYNAEPENRTYLYDYFVDNCATRLRDIYSWATGGEFERWLKAQPSPETTRETVDRYLFRSSFLPAWVINYLLGPSVDKEETMWEACFLPDTLLEKMEEFQKAEATAVYTTAKRRAVPEKWSLTLRSLVFGIILALLAAVASGKKRSFWTKGADALLGILYAVFFVISVALVFMRFFTIHFVTHGNLNIFILSPLVLLQAIAHFGSLRKNRRTKLLFVSSVLSLFLALGTMAARLFIPSLIQDSLAVFLPMALLYTTELILNYKRN